MQTPRKWLAALCCNGIIYALGCQSGQNPDTTTQSVKQFNVNEGSWRFASSMIAARHAHAACGMNGKIFVDVGLDVVRRECWRTYVEFSTGSLMSKQQTY